MGGATMQPYQCTTPACPGWRKHYLLWRRWSWSVTSLLMLLGFMNSSNIFSRLWRKTVMMSLYKLFCSCVWINSVEYERAIGSCKSIVTLFFIWTYITIHAFCGGGMPTVHHSWKIPPPDKIPVHILVLHCEVTIYLEVSMPTIGVS